MTCTAPELSAFLKTLDKISVLGPNGTASASSVWPCEIQVERREKKTKK